MARYRFVRFDTGSDGQPRALFAFGPFADGRQIHLLFSRKMLERLVWWMRLLRTEHGEERRVLDTWPKP